MLLIFPLYNDGASAASTLLFAAVLAIPYPALSDLRFLFVMI